MDPTIETTVVTENVTGTVLNDSNYGHNERDYPSNDMINDWEIPFHFNSRHKLFFGNVIDSLDERKVKSRKEEGKRVKYQKSVDVDNCEPSCR